MQYEDLLSVDVEATEGTQEDGEVLYKLYGGLQATSPSASSQSLSTLFRPTSHSSPAGLLSVPGILWTLFHLGALTSAISSSYNF